LAAIRQGFNGSPLDNWTVGFLSGAINQLKGMTGSAYIAGAVTSALIGAGIGVLAIYTVGALMPNKATKYLGRFAAIKFPSSGLHRINYKLWLCAALLGMLADLPAAPSGTSSRPRSTWTSPLRVDPLHPVRSELIMIVLAAGDAHITENPGWGKLAFLVGAALLFWLGKSAFERSRGLKEEGHSPAPKGDPRGWCQTAGQ
jgi:hypothetical protein